MATQQKFVENKDTGSARRTHQGSMHLMSVQTTGCAIWLSER